jgi:hypothetical protein
MAQTTLEPQPQGRSESGAADDTGVPDEHFSTRVDQLLADVRTSQAALRQAAKEKERRELEAARPKPALRREFTLSHVVAAFPALASPSFWFGLVAFAAALAIGYGVMQREAPPLPVTAKDFQTIPAVALTMTRPPDVYLSIETKTWKGMPADERMALLERLAAEADSRRYAALHLLTHDGALAGQWRKAEGSRLF